MLQFFRTYYYYLGYNPRLKVLVVVCLCLNGQGTLGHDDIGMDTARIIISSEFAVTVSTQSDECYKCDLMPATKFENDTVEVLVDTRWKTRLNISTKNPQSGYYCSESYLSRHFKEHGIYKIDVKLAPGEDTIKCTMLMTNSPDSEYIALYGAVGVMLAVALLWVLFSKFCWDKLCRLLETGSAYVPLQDKVSIKSDGTLSHSGLISSIGGTLTSSTEIAVRPSGNKNVQATGTPEQNQKKERLKSLDTFRGISIVIMIFVNYGGGGYWFFSHSKWNGLTVADLVFPWFIFIMGTSMAYSFSSLLKKNTPKHKIFLKIFRRSCILFFLGLVINTNGTSSVDVKNIRIPGVLQRFSWTYFVIATMHMCFAKKPDSNLSAEGNGFRDVLEYWPEWIINFCFIILHTCLTFLLRVPGCDRGYFGPGGYEDHRNHFNCTGGAAGYIDRQVFGVNHIYGSPTSKEIYKSTLPYDPEGLLGTLTSCFLCFLGLQAGKILMTYKEPKSRVVRFVVWGLLLCFLAGLLCKFSKNGGWIPVNKNLWSLSFVLCLGGFAFLLLCFCYLTIDKWKLWNGAPFYYPGMNAITIYMGHELFHNNFPVSWEVPETHASLLPLELYGTTFWVLVATYLYYKKTFYVI